ncbi:MAG TPA: hypothetical protein VMD30_04755 [Tepidisphaeraceae bacterium]|nr:hypothetical protein [Tepidisphaeraceae bacterium]
MCWILAITTDEFDQHLHSLLFMCFFFIAVILAAMWWIRRS